MWQKMEDVGSLHNYVEGVCIAAERCRWTKRIKFVVRDDDRQEGPSWRRKALQFPQANRKAPVGHLHVPARADKLEHEAREGTSEVRCVHHSPVGVVLRAR
ncbi:hypothetical protein Tdes44962_MAKER00263 [Teratosphaeria destructans]|uniref:Uncharacterized protein n=1 Tax=Teratosphaeria destructans TaxID=418781 RepID=A0A9W7SVG5_9PEZI|nr:hypothetical protein Tdes44962_MAKER00263 [Teratosphaeria destructans]